MANIIKSKTFWQMTREETLAQLRKAREKKPPKVYKGLAKKSPKKIAEEKEQKELRGGDDTLMEQFFKRMRTRMTGTCQCGCGQPSQKKDDMYFRHSIAHIFPKKDFESVMYHPLNWVERRFWSPACHTNMDNRSMDLWVNFADWDDIKEKLHALAPLLTNEERANKFYTKLEKLIYEK